MSDKKTAIDKGQSIRKCVEEALDNYFADMDGHQPSGLYALILAQTEEPMLKVVLRHTGNNLTQTANILGINRATLRRKLKHYGLEKEGQNRRP